MSARGRLLAIVLAVVVIGALTYGGMRIFGGSGDTPAATGTAKTTTSTIQRGTLVDRQSVSGTLTYGDSTAVVANKNGTITKVAAQGSSIKRNGVLWKIDESPTVLFYGAVPAYRALTSGDSGTDVTQLNANLRALGYDAGTEDSFTSGTTSAVKSWQGDLGLTESGTVALGDVVFQSGVARVGSVVANVGGTASRAATVLELTTTTRVVSVDLATSQQSLAFRGETVVVTMPDGSEANGKVSEIGSVATSASTSSGSGSSGGGSGSSASSSSSTVPVTITLDGKVASAWDQAPVQVAMQSSKRDKVLIAPVTALLALQEGGYAVELVNGTSSNLVAVKTGLFAGGKVEVSGNGIKAGTVVKVPVSL